MAHTRAWDETDPADTDLASGLGDDVRTLKEDIRERAEVDHYWPDASDAGGEHEALHLREQSGAPTVAADHGGLYGYLADGQCELHWKDEASNVIQLTQDGIWIAPHFSGSKATRDALTGVEGMLFFRTDIHPGAIDRYESAAWVRRAGPFQGQILMWSGSVGETGDYLTNLGGWCLCRDQGTVNGLAVPDLRDKFIVGSGSTYSIGDTGGEASHTLLEAEMPSHTHDVSVAAVVGGAGRFSWTSQAHQAYQATESAGSDTAHENRPPYYALAYIIFADIA